MCARAVNDSSLESAPGYDFHTFLLAIPALALLPAGIGSTNGADSSIGTDTFTGAGSIIGYANSTFKGL